MPSNQTTRNPPLDLSYGATFVSLSVLGGYGIEGLTTGLLFGALAGMLYLLYRIWRSVELIAATL